MKKALKVIGILLSVVIVLALIGVVYFNSAYPKVGPAPNIKFEYTKERVERGKYLANHVTGCIDCHSTRDWTKFTAPLVPGTEGAGGMKYDKSFGLPGTIYARNLTPHNLGNWTDGEIMRAIVSGVNKNGDVLFPLMPYEKFRSMTQEDLYSIIAYIRTLKPIKNEIPKTEIDFPVSMMIKMAPRPYEPQKSPDPNNPKEWGKYLVTIGGCEDCHTQAKEGKPVAGMEFAGGMEANVPWGTVRVANITPDKETGIGAWSKEDFINRFKMYRSEDAFVKVNMKSDFNTIMPWSFIAGMKDEDLGAIYEYLRTVKPVRNAVNRFSPPGSETVTNRQ